VTVAPPLDGADCVLLLSGGMDSAALAYWVRPAAALYIDYGQRPADSEQRAATAVAGALGIPIDFLRIDLSPLGAGLLLTEEVGGSPTETSGANDLSRTAAGVVSPSPEWWPLRNQLLCSLAAAWALSARVPSRASIRKVLTATVAGDGSRHVDGTSAFYEAMDAVTSMQEGNIRVLAPAAGLGAAELVRDSGVTEDVLGWTHSCHRSSIPCAACPGCWKRFDVLAEAGMLGHVSSNQPVDCD
jgi:7-cyano-7-deazaguanine synthase